MTNSIIIFAMLLLLHSSYLWSSYRSSNFGDSCREGSNWYMHVILYVCCIGLCSYAIFMGGIQYVDETYDYLYDVLHPMCCRHPFVTSLLATIFALIIAFRYICPRIRIKAQISKIKDNEYSFIFKNYTLMHCSDIEISVYGYKYEGAIRKRVDFESAFHLLQLDGLIASRDQETSKGVLIQDIEKYDSIELSIKATHPLSNVTKVFKQSYDPAKDIESEESQIANYDVINHRSTMERVSFWRKILCIVLICTYGIYKTWPKDNTIIYGLFNAEIITILLNELYYIILSRISAKSIWLHTILITITVIILITLLVLIAVLARS